MSNTTPERPVKLQINTAGAWRDVITFDVQDGDDVMHQAEQLAKWSAHADQVKMRVIMPGDTAPLQLWTPQRGWHEWRSQ